MKVLLIFFCVFPLCHNPVEGVDPVRRDKLIELLDINLQWRMHKVSDGQRRRVQICMGLLHPYKVKFVSLAKWWQYLALCICWFLQFTALFGNMFSLLSNGCQIMMDLSATFLFSFIFHWCTSMPIIRFWLLRSLFRLVAINFGCEIVIFIEFSGHEDKDSRRVGKEWRRTREKDKAEQREKIVINFLMNSHTANSPSFVVLNS